MKKPLLALGVAALTLAANAITADEAQQMTLRFDYAGDTPLSTSANTTNPLLTASTSVEGMWEVTEFYNDINLKVSIADDGAVTIAPQTLGGDYDYTTYEMIYYMIVPAASADKGPMEVYNDRVYGTCKDGRLEIEPWNIIKVNQSFSENLGAVYAEGHKTVIAAPNASVQRGMWMADLDDYDRFSGWDRMSLWPDRHNVRVDVTGDHMTIGNFLGMYTECPVATFALDLDAKTVTFDAMTTVVRTASGSDYTIMAIPETLVNEHQEGLDTPVTGTISDDMTTITINNFCVMRSDEMFRNVDYCHGNPVHTLIITLDEPLNKDFTAIDNTQMAKTITGVQYVDLSGRVAERPFAGVNVVITRYADGTQNVTKAVF